VVFSGPRCEVFSAERRTAGFHPGLFRLPLAELVSPVKAQVTDRMVAACQGVATGKEDLKVRGDFEEAPQIEHGKGADIITALALDENLPAQGQPFAKITLEEPPAKGVVALPGASTVPNR
jgi:hypothetical protein